MSFFLTKSPILGSIENHNDILNNLPIGIVILTQGIQLSLNEYIISNTNKLGRKLLSIPKDNNINKFIKNLSHYQEFSFYHNKKETSLYDHIFKTKELSNKTYIHNNTILYIKVRRDKNNIYILIDNYEDERKNIQSQFVKNIGYQYLLTLYHEINNPVNCLLSIVNDNINFNSNCAKRIELLIYLIRFFLKNFILYFQLSTFNKKEKHKLNLNSTINLENIFNRISVKFSKLFEYKRIIQNENFELLINKCTNLDYFYFKNLIKMIYLYFYKTIPKEGKFLVNVETTNEKNILKITFSNTIKKERTRSYSNAEILNLECLNQSNLTSNIQTQKMTENIIKKIIEILHIQNEYNFDIKNSFISIYILIDNEIKFGNENELDELTSEHLDSMRLITRSVTDPTFDNTSKNEYDYNSKNENLNSDNSNSEKSNFDNDKSNYSESYSNELNNSNIKPKKVNKRYKSFQFNYNNILHNQIKNIQFNRFSVNINNRDNKLFDFSKSKTVLQILKKNYLKENGNNKLIKQNSYKKMLHNNIIDKLNNQSRNHSMFQLRNNIKENYINNIIIKDKKKLNKSNSQPFIFSNINKNEHGINLTEDFKKRFLKQSSLKISKRNKNEFHNHKIEDNIIENKKNFNDSFNKKNNNNNNINFNYSSINKYNTFNNKNNIFNNNDTFNNNNNYNLIKQIPSLFLKPPDIKKQEEKCCNDVMIVDDEQFNLTTLSNNLKKLNILSDSCSDGIECLDLIKKRLEKNCNCNKNYKLILMDLIMPKMNGLETIKQIKYMINEKLINENYLNVVFISANIDQKESLIDIQKKYPFVKGFLTKPVKISKIKDMLKRYYYV